MDEAQFIEDSVRLQLGGILDRALALTEESRARALAGSSGSTLAWNSSEGVPYPANGWRLKQGAKPFDADALENAQKFINGAKAQGFASGQQIGETRSVSKTMEAIPIQERCRCWL